jgi:hypothetical protein
VIRLRIASGSSPARLGVVKLPHNPGPVSNCRQQALTLAMMLLALGSAGCGGGTGHGSRPPVLGKAFQGRALTVCRAALARKKAQGPFPYPDFNPTRPDRSKLPGVARFEAKTVKIYERWRGEMLALGQPPTGRAAWANVLRALDSHVRIIVEQQAAARRGDSKTFADDYYAGNKAQDEMQRGAEAAGVPVCAAAAAA